MQRSQQFLCKWLLRAKAVRHDLQTILFAVLGARFVFDWRRDDGAAAVVDPQRDIEHYLIFAAEHKLKIKHVILTHLHADFVAGHLELRDRVGATIYLGAAARRDIASRR